MVILCPMPVFVCLNSNNLENVSKIFYSSMVCVCGGGGSGGRRPGRGGGQRGSVGLQ